MSARALRARTSTAGYSLVEVIVALGILTGVILAIASMFTLGQASVKSGKLMTEATSIGQDIMEDVNKLSYNGLQVFFVGAQNLSTLQVYTADTRGAGSYAKAQYDTQIRNKLWKGYATIQLRPIGGTASPVVWASGEAIRITVTVFWKELRRDRTVTVEGVRF